MKPTIESTILVRQDVGEALKLLRKKMADFSIDEGKDLLEGIEADYNLMRGCFCKGVRDPRGAEVYMGLLRRTYRLYGMVRLASIIRKRVSYSQCKTMSSGFAICGDVVRGSLEEFVQEEAMVSLLPENQRQESAMRVRADHKRYVERLFCALVVAGQWNADASAAYLRMLLSPTIRQDDALLVVSAVTLSLLTVFDVHKWLMLSSVYESSKSEPLRQRALVGVVLALPAKDFSIFPEVATTLRRICGNDVTRRELLELQMQIFYCSRTKEDSMHIQRDIMPTIVKNSGMKITRAGIEEKEDSIDDILDGGAADHNVAELEDKINKMADMQKSGHDIYFGGFSQMKRFPFFSHMCNWFVPFSVEHPDVECATIGKDMSFSHHVLSRLPFCDSDKYSFTFALAAVVDKLPREVKDVLAGDENGGVGEMLDRVTPAYIRRMYIQDLYRFFMLYEHRGDFRSPLAFGDAGEGSRGLFLLNPLLVEYLLEERSELVRFLFRQHQFSMVVYAMSSCVGNASESELLVLGNSYMRLGRYSDAYDVFSVACDRFADCGLAKRGLADAAFMLHGYAEAVGLYEQLMSCGRNTESLVVCHSLSLINSGQVSTGLGALFKLYYEDPTDSNVRRAIAWGYLMDMRPQEAERIYDRLVADNESVDADVLNCGYAKWLQNKMDEAVAIFKRYVNDGHHNLADDFTADKDLFDLYGIEQYERKIMLGMIVD